MNRYLKVLVMFFFALAATQSAADDEVRGRLAFLDGCPGDAVVSGKAEDEIAGFLAAILTPFLTGVVNQGLKAAGTKLSEAAKEMSIDVHHFGDHLYLLPGDPAVDSTKPVWVEEPSLKHACVIVVSKGKDISRRNKKFNLAHMANQYYALNLSNPDNPVVVEDPQKSFKEYSENPLLKWLKEEGYSDDQLPGLVAVFDIRLSAQKTEARLEPRYIYLNHSVRESKQDSNIRTFSFEFDFSVPGQDGSFGKPLVKVDKLKIGQPFLGKDNPQKTSTWYSLPPVNVTANQLTASMKETHQKIQVETQKAVLAAKAADIYNIPNIPDDVSTGNPKCPVDYEDRLIEESGKLVEEQRKKAAKLPNMAAEYEQSVLYFASCSAMKALQSNAIKLSGLFVDEARSFDAIVDIKEFRERQFAKFFGSVLSDDTTRSGLTTAIVGQIDPATREANEDAKETANITAMEAFDTAMTAALVSIATYEATPDTDTTKSAKFIDMESKKRAANRKAKVIVQPLPFPDSGLWYGL